MYNNPLVQEPDILGDNDYRIVEFANCMICKKFRCYEYDLHNDVRSFDCGMLDCISYGLDFPDSSWFGGRDKDRVVVEDMLLCRFEYGNYKIVNYSYGLFRALRDFETTEIHNAYQIINVKKGDEIYICFGEGEYLYHCMFKKNQDIHFIIDERELENNFVHLSYELPQDIIDYLRGEG